MMLAKLTATLPTRSAPEATRMTAISACALRTRVLIMPRLFMNYSPRAIGWGGQRDRRSCPSESMFRSDGADLNQHVMHGRLVFRHIVGDAAEQRLHLSEVLRRQRVNLAAHFHPIVRQLLGEFHLPGLHLGLDGLCSIEDDLLQIGRQFIEPGLT